MPTPPKHNATNTNLNFLWSFGSKEHVGEVYEYSFNGFEKDDEIAGSGNSYDMGARMYNPRLGKPFSPDPLIIHKHLFPELSPYNFAGNTPIWAIDLQGLQPEAVVTKTSDGKYQFTEPAIKLLSWLSGTSENVIRNTTIKPRSIPFGGPWYPVKIKKIKGQFYYFTGGGLTSDEKIRYTRNFFKGWKQAKNKSWGYFGGNDNDAIDAWLSISAHETGHLRQAKKFKTNLGYYFSFIGEYIKGGSHDASGKEQDAERGQTKYKDFVRFTNKNYGKNSLVNLFNNKDLSDEDKIKVLDKWMKAYDASNQSQEKEKKQE